MKVVFALALLGLVAFAAAADFPKEDGVLVLDSDNFDDAIEAHDTLLVEFYAPWCGHCKKLAPEYAAAAAVLAKSDLFVAKVDATENRELGERFGVSGFPTLKFFRGGKASDYGGGRTEKEIVQWVTKKSGPPATTLNDAESAKNFVEGSDVAVIGFFDDATSDEAKAFLKAAAGNDDVPFGITSDAGAYSEYAASNGDIALFKVFDEGRNDYDGESDADAIAAFVSANQLPLVIPFSQEMAPKIFGGDIKTHQLLFLDTDADYATDLLAEYRTVATEFKGRALSITVSLEHDRVMSYFGISADDLPRAVIVNMPEDGAMKKFLFDGDEISGAALTEFGNRYFAGDVKPFLKSEEIPEDNDEPVTVLVGKNFEAVALDPTKDVLVEFYAPWCGHCKSLAPKYEELGEKFADVDSVIIAKMDATANEVDHPDVNVKGFPTLKFFPAGEGAGVVDFSGARETDAMLKFIVENAASEFELDDESAGEL